MATEMLRRDGLMFSPVRKLMSELFEEPYFTEVPTLADETILPLDIYEDEKLVKVIASVPGFKRDEITIEVKDNVLFVEAAKKDEIEEKSERYFRRERKVQTLTRRVSLPVPVIETEALAELKDGVLTLTLPKNLKSQPKRITIK